jgi:hypothetical protein
MAVCHTDFFSYPVEATSFGGFLPRCMEDSIALHANRASILTPSLPGGNA